MQKRNSLLLAALVTLAILLSAYPALKSVEAQTSGSAALTGQITSQEEGAMEGVLISAKRAGSTVTLTVVSDHQGHYTFPPARLEEGRYALHARAVGYDMVDPGPVDITPSKPITLDLKLRKTGNLAAQLSNTEWLLSVPGTQEQKLGLMGCVSCHSLERIVRSQHDPAEWVQTLQNVDLLHGKHAVASSEAAGCA